MRLPKGQGIFKFVANDRISGGGLEGEPGLAAALAHPHGETLLPLAQVALHQGFAATHQALPTIAAHQKTPFDFLGHSVLARQGVGEAAGPVQFAAEVAEVGGLLVEHHQQGMVFGLAD